MKWHAPEPDEFTKRVLQKLGVFKLLNSKQVATAVDANIFENRGKTSKQLEQEFEEKILEALANSYCTEGELLSITRTAGVRDVYFVQILNKIVSEGKVVRLKYILPGKGTETKYIYFPAGTTFYEPGT